VAVKIVTDSPSDIPSSVATELDITVIPVNVIFDNKSYRDGIDLTTEEFYTKLTQSKSLPTTSIASPGTFAETFDRVARETDEILVITISQKFSAAHQVALQGRELMKQKCRVEIIDSQAGATAQGLIVIASAKAAKAGAKLDELVELTRRNIPRSEIRIAFDTLEYLKRGGRIGRAQALLGSILHVNPVLGIKNGEAYPYARPHSRAKAIEYLCNFVLSFAKIEEAAVEDATTPDEADKIVECLSTKYSREKIYHTKFSPVVGAHVGPHVLAVSVLGDK
jgi:DegV family protein with EDD domain